MSKITWHKSAVKDVRPFFGAATLEESLGGAEIRIYDDAPFTSEIAFSIEPEQASKLSIAVRPNLNAAAIDGGALKKDKLQLAVTAVHPFLKRTILIGQFPLSGKIPDEITIEAEVIERLGGGSNMNVELVLCLAKALPKKPGTPFLAGHWISKKSFSLRQPKPAEDYDIVPMDDEGWKAMGLPAKTLYYVEYFGGVNEPSSKDRQIAKVRLHSDVHKKLAADSNQRLAKPLMSWLAAEIACQILATSFSDWESAEEAVSQSALATFLKQINKMQPCTLDDLRMLVRQSGMLKLRALLHSDLQSVRSVAEA